MPLSATSTKTCPLRRRQNDRDRAPVLRVFDGVVDQVGDRPLEVIGVAQDAGDDAFHFNRKRLLLALGRREQQVGRLADDRRPSRR